MTKTPKQNLETTFNQIESTIEILEDETSSLQESLDSFEHGISLTRQAQKILLKAEQKVKLLLESEGEPFTKDFDELRPE